METLILFKLKFLTMQKKTKMKCEAIAVVLCKTNYFHIFLNFKQIKFIYLFIYFTNPRKASVRFSLGAGKFKHNNNERSYVFFICMVWYGIDDDDGGGFLVMDAFQWASNRLHHQNLLPIFHKQQQRRMQPIAEFVSTN